MRYCCPCCDRIVWHQCNLEKYHRRGFRRLVRLPRLKAVDREEIREDHRQAWRDTSPLFENFAANVDDVHLLRRIEDDA